MGESSAATVREIEDIRDRLEANFTELERRMPAPAVWVKRAAGIAIGGGIGALLLRSILKRARGRPDEEPVAATVASPGGGGAWKPLLALGAGALIVLHVMELRELRRLRGRSGADRWE